MFDKRRFTFTFVLAISCTMISLLESAPDGGLLNVQCRKSLDCQPGECCVLGMMRYSFPQCLPYTEEGGYCNPNNVAKNYSITYPNGLQLDLTNTYTLFCPCDATVALSCRQGHCQSRIETDTPNNI